MGNYKVLICGLIALIMIQIASAATIYGSVYDFSLNNVNNARVEIDTSPQQFLIARNGSYSFNVPNGAYTIKAQLMQKNTVVASVQENITIKQDGSYVLDLILFPDVEEGIENPELACNLFKKLCFAWIKSGSGWPYKKAGKMLESIKLLDKKGNFFKKTKEEIILEHKKKYSLMQIIENV